MSNQLSDPQIMQAHSAKKLNLLTLGLLLTSLASFFLSIVMLLYTVWPQKIVNNTDYEKQAKAGNTDAQVFLAHHYYEVGDYESSIYWYKLATMDRENINYAAALNNLAYLYLNYCNLSMETGNHYHEIERGLLALSAKNGSPVGRRNLYFLLVSTPDQEWTEINYSQELALIKYMLRENHEWTDELSRFETGWEYVESTEGIDYSSNEEYTVIHVPGGVVTVITESGGEIVIPTYRNDVYRKTQPGPDPEFSYQDPVGEKFSFEMNTLSSGYTSLS